MRVVELLGSLGKFGRGGEIRGMGSRPQSPARRPPPLEREGLWGFDWLSYAWPRQRRRSNASPRVRPGAFPQRGQSGSCSGGELWAYNLYFPGVLGADDAFASWHREVYLARYPSPPRRSDTVERLIETTPGSLVFVEKWPLRFQVDFPLTSFVAISLTRSNVEAALRRGATLHEVDTWLGNELAPFFRAGRERFEYIGAVEIAAA